MPSERQYFFRYPLGLMKNKHVVIYVPGLGDHRLTMRQRLLSTWRYKNLSIEILPMKWAYDESWNNKLSRLLSKIDRLHDDGLTVSVVGESAGATAAVQALQSRDSKVNAVVLLCGKFQQPERVASRLYQSNPALREAIIRSNNIIGELSQGQKNKILNLHPLADPVVPVWETKIPGVKEATMPVIGHITGIGFGITIWSFRIVRFVRSIPK